MTKRNYSWAYLVLPASMLIAAPAFCRNARSIAPEVITAQEAVSLLRVDSKSFEILLGTSGFPCRALTTTSQIRCNRTALLVWLTQGTPQRLDNQLLARTSESVSSRPLPGVMPLSSEEINQVRGKGKEATTEGSSLSEKTQGIEPTYKESRLIRSDIPVLRAARSTTIAFNYGFSSLDQPVPGLGLGSDLTRTNSVGMTLTRGLTDKFSAFLSADFGRSYRRVEDTLSFVPVEFSTSSRLLTFGFNYELPIFKQDGAPRSVLSTSFQPKTSYSSASYKSTLTLTKDYDPATIFGSVGLRYDDARNSGGSEVPSSLSMLFNAGGALAVNDQLTLSAAYNFSYATRPNYYDGLQIVRYTSSISPSATLVVGKSSVVYMNLNFPLGSFSANQSFGLGYQYSF